MCVKGATMRNDRVLFVLVVADFVLVLLVVGAEWVLNSTLPQPLRDYTGGWSFADILRFPLWVGIAIVTLVSWIGLLNYWWPARILYVVAWAAWLLLVAASGPTVTTATGATSRPSSPLSAVQSSASCISRT